MHSISLWEALGKLPHLSRAGHVDDVDVNVLRIKKRKLTNDKPALTQIEVKLNWSFRSVDKTMEQIKIIIIKLVEKEWLPLDKRDLKKKSVWTGIKLMKSNKKTRPLFLTWFLLRSTISSLAASARPLCRQTMWTIPPECSEKQNNQQTEQQEGFWGAEAKTLLKTHSPLLAISCAVAFPIPLLAPVITKDLPLRFTSRSAGTKCFAAAS